MILNKVKIRYGQTWYFNSLLCCRSPPDKPSRRANIVKKGISPAGANLTRFSENDKYQFKLITIAMMVLKRIFWEWRLFLPFINPTWRPTPYFHPAPQKKPYLFWNFSKFCPSADEEFWYFLRLFWEPPLTTCPAHNIGSNLTRWPPLVPKVAHTLKLTNFSFFSREILVCKLQEGFTLSALESNFSWMRAPQKVCKPYELRKFWNCL